MKKTLIILVLFLVGFTMKVYSKELPTLFGIELGKPLPDNVQIINKGTNIKYIHPLFPYEFFQTYSVKIRNNVVVRIIAEASNTMCLRSNSLEEMILKETNLKLRDGLLRISDGAMRIGEGENSKIIDYSESLYLLESTNFYITLDVRYAGGVKDFCEMVVGLGSY